MLALKAAPLLLALPGVLFARRYTYQWSAMLVLAYFTEGVVRAWSERGMSQSLAAAEVVLSLIFFVCAVALARLARATASAPEE